MTAGACLAAVYTKVISKLDTDMNYVTEAKFRHITHCLQFGLLN